LSQTGEDGEEEIDKTSFVPLLLHFYFSIRNRETTSPLSPSCINYLSMKHLHLVNFALGYVHQSSPVHQLAPAVPVRMQKAFRVRCDFVQIPLSQVPRRETLGSTQKFGAGALVDRVLRFCNSYGCGPAVRLETSPLASVEQLHNAVNHEKQENHKKEPYFPFTHILRPAPDQIEQNVHQTTQTRSD
jgi:hypothetical protein